MYEFELVIAAKTDAVSDLISFIDAVLPDDFDAIRVKAHIAADEVFSNIVRHAGLPEDSVVHVRVAVDKRGVVFTFVDNGVPFNPLANDGLYAAPKSPEDEITGLGIFMLMNVADDVGYRREDGRNVLRVSVLHY